MSLPCKFENPQIYFYEAMKFLEQYSWIYRTANTAFLKDDVLENFPMEWISYFDKITIENLNLFPQKLNRDASPKSLIEFQEKVTLLKPNLNVYAETGSSNNNSNFRKISKKKIHEITILKNYILKACRNRVDIFIDFGSGLGYLSEFICKFEPDVRIIGLEAESTRIETALNRQKKYYPNTTGKIFFIQHFINEYSYRDFIAENIKNLYPNIPNPRIAIIGLHSCADLTVTSMKIFLHNPTIQNLIIIPCCYHKLQMHQNNDCGMLFTNFPLSEALKNVCKSFNFEQILNRPFLRLACQQATSRWLEMTEEDHKLHGTEMFIRAALESLKIDNEIVCKKKKHETNFIIDVDKINLENIEAIYEFRTKCCAVEWTENRRIKLKHILENFPNGWKLAEALTCLQTSMQEICENIVLFDRIFYLEEQSKVHNIKLNCKFEKIFHDKLSPRCFVLNARKI